MNKKVEKGDYIEIVDPLYEFYEFNIGDVFKVKKHVECENKNLSHVQVEETDTEILESEYRVKLRCANIKTIKRKAMVGERILIVSSFESSSYSNGDIFEVSEVSTGRRSVVYTDSIEEPIFDFEYEIMEEAELFNPQDMCINVLEAKVSKLEVEVEKLRNCMGRIEADENNKEEDSVLRMINDSEKGVKVDGEQIHTGTTLIDGLTTTEDRLDTNNCQNSKSVEKDSNKERARVIKTAKQYVNNIEKALANGEYNFRGKDGTWKKCICEVEYVNDAEDNLVLVIIREQAGSREVFDTQLIPHEAGTVYNKDIAKAGALSNVIGDYTVILEDLPQPTKLVPGMVVYDTYEDVGGGIHNELEIISVKEPVYRAISRRDGQQWLYNEWFHEGHAVILEDSDVDYDAHLNELEKED